MNPQDDPEARIRALEPTELGAEQPGPSHHGAPPPLPPPIQPWPEQPPYGHSPYGTNPYGADPHIADPYAGGYISPYPSTTQGSGLRAWMLIVPIVIVLTLAAGVGAVLWLLNSNSTPGTVGGGGVLTNEPVIPSLPELPDLPTIIVDPGSPGTAPGASAEPGSTITVTGIGSNRSVLCNDNILIISGANNTVEVTGHCVAVTVSGFENAVTAESADEITVSGFENRVTFRDGTPNISQSGSGNVIEQG